MSRYLLTAYYSKSVKRQLKKGKRGKTNTGTKIKLVGKAESFSSKFYQCINKQMCSAVNVIGNMSFVIQKKNIELLSIFPICQFVLWIVFFSLSFADLPSYKPAKVARKVKHQRNPHARSL